MAVKNKVELSVSLGNLCSKSLLASQIVKGTKLFQHDDRKAVLKALRQIQQETAECIEFLKTFDDYEREV